MKNAVRLCALLFVFGAGLTLDSNVCETDADYRTIKNNSKCWYDFTADSTLADIIIKSGYPLEEHKVITKDGYILTIFRIPNERLQPFTRKEPVFLQHGVESTGATFVAIGNKSLAFLLSDSGYDVWIGNYRGTEYSEEHVNLTVYDDKFWDYSIDEIGLYDIPAQLNYIATVTGQWGNILYIGYSLGGTSAIIYGTSYPEEAKKTVKMFLYMAPCFTFKHMKSPLRFIAPFGNMLLAMVKNRGLTRSFSQGTTSRVLMNTPCYRSPFLMRQCLNLHNIFYGPDSQIPAQYLPVYLNLWPGGTSMKVINHIGISTMNGLRRYDYGLGNLLKYGSLTPPSYDISKMNVPNYIIYAKNDWACSKGESLELYQKLPEDVRYGIYEIGQNDFNHIDFVFGKNVRSLVFDHILRLFHVFTSH